MASHARYHEELKYFDWAENDDYLILLPVMKFLCYELHCKVETAPRKIIPTFPEGEQLSAEMAG